jgi:hypothetical protein
MYKKALLRHEPSQLALVLQISNPEPPIPSTTVPPLPPSVLPALCIDPEAAAQPLPNEDPDIALAHFFALARPPAIGDPNPNLADVLFRPTPDVRPEEVDDLFSLPSLSSALDQLSASDDGDQRQAFKTILVLFTVSAPSPKDWQALLDSDFFPMAASLSAELTDHKHPDHQLVVFCLNRALSHALTSSFSIDNVICGFASPLLQLFETVTGVDAYIDTYFDIGAEIMALTRQRALADDIFNALTGAIVPLVQHSDLIDVVSDLWWLIHEWFSCGAITSEVDITFLVDYMVPAIFAVRSDDLPLLDFHLILAIGDACNCVDGFPTRAIEQGLPGLLQAIIVASTKKELTRACFELLSHFVEFMAEALPISSACVDALLDHFPGLVGEIFALALRALPSDTECQKFWNQRAAWAVKHFQDSHTKMTAVIRSLYEATDRGHDLIKLVGDSLIPRLCDFLESEPSDDDRARTIEMLVACAQTDDQDVSAHIAECCSRQWFDEILGTLEGAPAEAQTRCGTALEVLLHIVNPEVLEPV